MLFFFFVLFALLTHTFKVLKKFGPKVNHYEKTSHIILHYYDIFTICFIEEILLPSKNVEDVFNTVGE